MRWLAGLLLLLVMSFVIATLHMVKKGQITYDAEGNDIAKSKFFSREIHWPGNSLSGVTIGRGYDLGFRSKATIEKELKAAGFNPKTIEQLKKGAGLRGKKARAFVKRNKRVIADITHEQQVKLFNYIYPKYEQRARKNYNKWTAEYDDKVLWDELHAPIRDVLVDFVYQGFTKGPNPMKAGMNNNFDELIRYIEKTKEIRQYERGRNRADYLKETRQAIEEQMRQDALDSESNDDDANAEIEGRNKKSINPTPKASTTEQKDEVTQTEQAPAADPAADKVDAEDKDKVTEESAEPKKSDQNEPATQQTEDRPAPQDDQEPESTDKQDAEQKTKLEDNADEESIWDNFLDLF